MMKNTPSNEKNPTEASCHHEDDAPAHTSSCHSKDDASESSCHSKDGASESACHHDHDAHDDASHAHGAHGDGCCGHTPSSLPKARLLSPEEAEGRNDLWFCPMCPGVFSEGPASCPKCGMALEPMMPTADMDDGGEYEDMKRRLWISLLFTIPLFIIAMGDMVIPGKPIEALFPANIRVWIELALATPVVLWAAFPFHERAVQSVRWRSPNMFTLISLGVLAAYIFSVFAVLFPGFFPEAMRTSGVVGVYFESAAVITALVLVGQVLELGARRRTGSAIRELLSMEAESASRVHDDGSEERVALDVLHVGDVLRVRPGERVPVDGVVLEGATAIDEAAISGEPMPVTKGAGDTVISSTINTTGAFTMRATHVGADTTLSRIVKMVAEAQRSQAPVQKLVDKVSSWFVPTVVVVSIVTFIAWLLFSSGDIGQRLPYALVNAIAVLIIACPCALGLATPMSIMVASGRGAQLGVLFRNAEAIEKSSSVDTVVLDKTGTLTEGKPVLHEIVTVGAIDEATLLHLTASIESTSEHPIAHAVVEAAKARGITLSSPRDFEALIGRGITGEVDGKRLAVGNPRLLAELSIDAPEHPASLVDAAGAGASVLSVAVDGVLAGYIVIQDTLRPESKSAIASLQSRGLRIIMATGDAAGSANAIAKELGIDEVHSAMLPADKDALVQKLQSEGHRVAMVGDGMNDAPALARAEVGVAMGTGTDVAMESSEVTLLHGNVSSLDRSIALSRATMQNIRQNLWFAFGYNALGIPIAAGVLYPVFGLLLSPMIAAAAMSLSSVSVITNALRLRRFKG